MSQQGRTETPKKPRMELSIAYCVTCNYRPIAAGLARSIEEATGLKTLLIPSREAGAFEVVADGEVTTWSKKHIEMTIPIRMHRFISHPFLSENLKRSFNEASKNTTGAPVPFRHGCAILQVPSQNKIEKRQQLLYWSELVSPSG